MTEGTRTHERPSRALARTVLDRYGVSIPTASDAWQGEESVGWKGVSSEGDRFVQRFPAWREVDDLAWCDSVARAASSEASACVHAIRSQDGLSVIATDEGPVMVFPFIDGEHPDNVTSIALQTAALLASMHRGIAATWSGPARPVPGGGHPLATERSDDVLVDPALDRWEHAMDAKSGMLPIHGDFYGGNLIVADGRVTGVIDWSDAQLAHPEQEVAWATWEFCQNEAGDDLVDEAADAFLGAYAASVGPARVSPPFDPLPWIRRRLRWEARRWFADPRSATEASAYHDAQLVAFERLRTRRLPGR